MSTLEIAMWVVGGLLVLIIVGPYIAMLMAQAITHGYLSVKKRFDSKDPNPGENGNGSKT